MLCKTPRAFEKINFERLFKLGEWCHTLLECNNKNEEVYYIHYTVIKNIIINFTLSMFYNIDFLFRISLFERVH